MGDPGRQHHAGEHSEEFAPGDGTRDLAPQRGMVTHPETAVFLPEYVVEVW